VILELDHNKCDHSDRFRFTRLPELWHSHPLSCVFDLQQHR
jgi:hypothetical protein